MQKAKLPAHCLCSFHPFDTIQRINIDNHSNKHIYCNQCIIEEEVPTSQSHLLSIEEFLNLASHSYSEGREKAKLTPDPPVEYLNVLSKKAENLDKLTKHINRQKDHIEQAFSDLRESILEALDHKKKTCFDILEEELSKVCNEYSLFEEHLHRAYPKTADINTFFPSRESLEKRVAMISDPDELDRVIEDIKYDLYQDQNDKREIYHTLRTMANSLIIVDSIKPQLDINSLGLQKLETTLKQNINKISPNLEIKEKFQPNIFSALNVPESTMLSFEDFALIQEWLSPNYNFSPKLIYRGSRDGMKGQIFHAKCDGKGPTITVIKCRFAGSSKLCVIGGFLDQSWHSREDWINSKDAFVFSLTSKTKCPVVEKRYAAFGGNTWGINFGGETLCVSSDLTLSYCSGESLRFRDCKAIIESDKPIGAERINFALKEIEVYLVQ